MKQIKVFLVVATALLIAVTVSCNKNKVTSVQLNRTELTLSVGDTAILIASVLPKEADNNAVNWKSDNPTAATVDNNGKITAKAVGIATITAITEDGNKTASCRVTVAELSLESTKWKLVGIVDVETGSMSVLEPKDCEDCYTLFFAEDFSTLPESTIIYGTDTIYGKCYYAQGRSRCNTIKLSNLNPVYGEITLVGCGWEEEYYGDALFRVHSYTFNKNELKCFYKERDTDKSKYLLYKPISFSLVNTAWKLVGMVDKQTGKLREFEPKEESCYTFYFHLNGFSCLTSNDLLTGGYKYNSIERTIDLLNILDYGGDETEIGDGVLYKEIVKTVHLFSYQNNELRMYFNNIDNLSGYLVFKQIKWSE